MKVETRSSSVLFYAIVLSSLRGRVWLKENDSVERIRHDKTEGLKFYSIISTIYYILIF